jgi:tripartite-type tricarboxylate transporter receptor subunit TctC
VRPIAITSDRRSPAAPDIPTVAEQGYPGYEATPWWGFGVPAATPRGRITRLNGDIVKAVQMPDVKERLSASGLQVSGSTPEHMDAVIREEVARWSKVVKAANIQPE